MAKYKIIPSSRTIVQSPISIGHKAEKGVEAIEFDLTAWVETYGSGTLTVIMRRWGDAIPYPIALEIDENNKATWTLSDTDTAKAGMAYAQLSYIVGDEVVKKSDIYTFRVMDSLTGEGEPPEAYDSWLEHLTHLAAEAMAEVLDIEGVATDKTLTVDGGIADGKATGDALALKADKSTTYTKAEVDQMIEDVEVETDTTLTISGAPADAKKTGDEIAAVKADLGDVTEPSKNLFDLNKLIGDITVTDGVVTASANALFIAMGRNDGYIPLGNIFEENTRYTISFEAMTEQNHGSTGNGIVIRFRYTDDTYSQVVASNTYTEYTFRYGTSEAGKTVKEIAFIAGNYGNNIWHIKNIQLEKGTAVTPFVLYGMSAVDEFARNEISKIVTPSVELKILGYPSYLGNAIIMMFDDGTTMLIDSFSANAWASVKADIDSCGIGRFDYFMLTHWHGDHMGNIENLINNGYIDSDTIFFLPQNLDTDATGTLPPDWDSVVGHFNTVSPIIENLGATVVHPTEGQEIELSGCKLKFWNTDHSVFYPEGSYPSQNYNDWSLCAYLFVGNNNICFTGDLGPIGQQKMVDLNTMVKANLYTATHHGWDNGNAQNYFGLIPAWINRLNPDVVFSEDYSVHNNYILTNRSPMQSWCERNCVPNYRTAINGSMDIHLDGYGWKFKGAYSKYIRAYDWGFDYQEKQLRAKIDATALRLLKPRYVSNSGNDVLYNAIVNMVGSEYVTGYKYTFRVRVIDSGNSNAYIDMLVKDFVRTVSAGTYEARFANIISINQTNNMGTFTLRNVSGTPTIIVEIVDFSQVE